MPYLKVGNCVYKKNPDGSRGEKVGCTSGDINKYMAALQMNAKSVSAAPGGGAMLHGPGSLLGVQGLAGQPAPRGPSKKRVRRKEAHLMDWLMPSEGHGVKETPADLALTKDAGGRWVWVMFTSSTFVDRDGDVLSKRAQDADTDHMNRTKEFGKLVWWHVGTPTNEDRYPTTPQLILGDCLFSAMHGKIRVEAGHFRDERVGEAFNIHSKELSASLAFAYPLTEPDATGTFWDIRTLERSVLPKEHAANVLAGLFTHKEKPMQLDAMKTKELEKLLGPTGPAVVEKLLADADQRVFLANLLQIRNKEAAAAATAGHAHSNFAHLHAVKGTDVPSSHAHNVMHDHAFKDGEAADAHAHPGEPPLMQHDHPIETPAEEVAEEAKAKALATKAKGAKTKEGEGLGTKVVRTAEELLAWLTKAKEASKDPDQALLTALRMEEFNTTLSEMQAAMETHAEPTPELVAFKEAQVAQGKRMDTIMTLLTELMGGVPEGLRPALPGERPSQSDKTALGGDNTLVAAIEAARTKEADGGPDRLTDWLLNNPYKPAV